MHVGRINLDELRTEPADYRGPLMMLDGVEDVPGVGAYPATAEYLDHVAGRFGLDKARWATLARRVGLTQAEAVAILRAEDRGMNLRLDLCDHVPGLIPEF